MLTNIDNVSLTIHTHFILARTQPIIVNATSEMLTTDILPVAQKLKEQARNLAKEEEAFQVKKRSRHTEGEDGTDIQEVCTIKLLMRLYIFS